MIERSVGQKTIGFKWVHKMKLKATLVAKGYKQQFNVDYKEALALVARLDTIKLIIDKYKAILVTKGYKKQFGAKYKEVFSLVARHDTIKLIVALIAQNSWPIF